MTTTGTAPRFAPARLDDLEALVALRIAAMRESLERIGRFDPVRARERLAQDYRPADTTLLLAGGELAGFWVQHRANDALVLDHLYVHPRHQGRGWGTLMLQQVLDAADAQGLDVTLGALRDSRANDFYRRHGFVPTHETAFDHHYRRPAARAAAQPAAALAGAAGPLDPR